MIEATAGAAGAISLDVAAIQTALKAEGLDAWLLYDFHGSNPIAADVTGAGRRGHMATRRWYYLIPASGAPRGLVHAIERHVLAHLPGTVEQYAGREQLERGLRDLVHGVRRVAMEYSPNGAIPYLGRVDAGTIELLRSFGLDIVSSGDLVQRFAAVWNAREIETHMQASEKLHRVKDRAFAAIRERLSRRTPTNEYDIQQLMMGWFSDEGLVTDSPPIVGAAGNGGNPHYMPSATDSRPIRPGEMVLLDLWGKLDQEGAVFADITWVGYTGSTPPEKFVKVFDVVAAARDAAVTLVQTSARNGRSLQGWQVDRAASSVLRGAGYGDHVLHRTGHSLGESVHGNGVNMDDYETHDDRRLLPGTGFTIEPGLYFDDFGIRLEIDMLVRDRDAIVTGPVQKAIVALS
ncbi:MAG TPA: M24 family metallopeptidase [Vicinamibacterales bacterium]|nr:M24 family metallopeptidase [Vicinamibacterales bacterium]